MTPLLMRPTFSGLLLAGLLPFAGSGEPDPVVIRHDRTDQEARELAVRFDATAAFVPDGCGTLIAPRWVLTAAHVGRGLSPFSPRIRVDGEEHGVRQVLFHPDSEGDGRRPPQVDLALVQLVEAVEGVEPVPLYRRSDEAGQDVFVVGYGDHGAAGARLTRGDGVRRAATNTVESAEGGRLRLTFDAPPDGTALEGVGGPGDSGGPLYLENDEGLFLAGVSFASMGGRPGSYGVVDLYVRASAFAKWVDETIEGAAGMPATGPDIREVSRGFPDGPRGLVLGAFFEAFNGDDADAMTLFAEDFRSASSRRRSPDQAFVHRMATLAEELAGLTPRRVALVSPAKWVVLADAGNGGKRAVYFRFGATGEDVRLADLGVRPEE